MKTLNLTRETIKKIINQNDIPNNSGLFGMCCNYDANTALKFDLSVLNNYRQLIDFNSAFISQISVAQIDKLARLGDKIKLSSLPQGIAYCENVPVAFILKYFGNHRSLLSLPCEFIDELCQNYIYQLDIKENNFLYSKTNFKAEAIDLDGIFIDIACHENIRQEELIYEKIVQMFMHLIEEKMIVSALSEDEINKRMEEVKSYYFGINNYYGVRALLRSVQKNNVLQKIK